MMVSGVTLAPGSTRMRTTVASVCGRNQLDRVLARDKAAGRRTHLADQRSALDRVGPDGRAIHRGRGRLEPRNRERERRHSHDSQGSPHHQPAFFLPLDVWPCDIHCTLSIASGLPRLKDRHGFENKLLDRNRCDQGHTSSDRFRGRGVRNRTVRRSSQRRTRSGGNHAVKAQNSELRKQEGAARRPGW